MARHSEILLNALREYDSFLDSLKFIADLGCGTGEDIMWWATLETRDERPEPYNYVCWAVDKDPAKLANIPDRANLYKLQGDFTKRCLPREADLIFAHDVLQYSTNPLETLKLWNEQMNVNGMLVLSVPTASGVEYNKYYSRSHSGCYYNHTPASLIYMLAVNGFDTRDAYMLKQFNDPWINIAVYKSDIKPMDPATTSWFDLAETGLLHPSVINSLNKFGHVRQEELIYPWLDKENYYVDWVPQWTEVPPEAVHTDTGIVNTVVASDKTTIAQAPAVTKNTKQMKSMGVLRASKGRYVK